MKAGDLVARGLGGLAVAAGLAYALGTLPSTPPAPAPAKVEVQATRLAPAATAQAGPAARSASAAPGPIYATPAIPPLVIPVEGVAAHQLTDTFTQARANGARRHDAIDIMAPTGTPVRAAASGLVEKLFLSRDGGNTVYIRSPDGRVIYYYAHLDRYEPGLVQGQRVRARQLLGTVGFSGNANPAAPHLHFAMLATRPEARWWDPAMALNPYPLLTRR